MVIWLSDKINKARAINWIAVLNFAKTKGYKLLDVKGSNLILINGENLSGSVLDVRNQNADDNRLEVEIHFNIIGVPHPHSVSINLQRLR